MSGVPTDEARDLVREAIDRMIEAEKSPDGRGLPRAFTGIRPPDGALRVGSAAALELKSMIAEHPERAAALLMAGFTLLVDELTNAIPDGKIALSGPAWSAFAILAAYFAERGDWDKMAATLDRIRAEVR